MEGRPVIYTPTCFINQEKKKLEKKKVDSLHCYGDVPWDNWLRFPRARGGYAGDVGPCSYMGEKGEYWEGRNIHTKTWDIRCWCLQEYGFYLLKGISISYTLLHWLSRIYNYISLKGMFSSRRLLCTHFLFRLWLQTCLSWKISTKRKTKNIRKSCSISRNANMWKRIVKKKLYTKASILHKNTVNFHNIRIKLLR